MRPLPKPTAIPTLVDLLDRLRPDEDAEYETLGAIMARIGNRSFSAVVLVISLLMVSPLSSVPLLAAFLAVIVLLTTVQAISGRETLWLPGPLVRREIGAARLNNAIEWLLPSARWLDRRRSGWMVFLTVRPFSDIAYGVVAVSALSWPPLSLIPLSTTIIAIGMTLVAAGLALKDGIFVIAGYAYLGLLAAGGVAVWIGVF